MAYLSGIGDHAFCELYLSCLDCQTAECFQCLHGLKIINTIVENIKTVFIIGKIIKCWRLLAWHFICLKFGFIMKIMKWVSLVTQHYKKMHNVHAVDVFQFYNLDFLILFFADDF